MGNLKHISLIGIDKNTDLDELEKLQKKYPLAEFGVILSKNWAENGNRYYNPSELYLSFQLKKTPTSKRSVGG